MGPTAEHGGNLAEHALRIAIRDGDLAVETDGEPDDGSEQSGPNSPPEDTA